MEAYQADVEATSGATVKIFVAKKLKATASSAGDVLYKGNPEILSNASSSGSVKKAD